jgi:hypothetical protein
MHRRAIGGGTRLEQLEVMREIRRVCCFDLRCERAQFLPLFDLARSGIAPLTKPPNQGVEGLLVGRVFQECKSVASLIDRFHSASPFNTSAR